MPHGVVFFGRLKNGKYFHFENQEENHGDLGASRRKVELDIHWYRVSGRLESVLSMEPFISGFPDKIFPSVVARWP